MVTSAPSPFDMEHVQLKCELFSGYLPLAHLKLLVENLDCVYHY